jgi:hypothetical protein
VALVPAASLAVHQLRYFLASGPGGARELVHQGHSYLHELTPWIILGCGLAFGGFLSRLARAWRTGRDDQPAGRRFVALWSIAALGLLSIYSGQEFLEGLFATGHPAGLVGVFGDGGLWAIPAALAVGLLLALAIRGARKVITLVAGRRGRQRRLAGRLVAVPRPRAAALRRLTPLASSAAGRAPPSRLALTLH